MSAAHDICTLNICRIGDDIPRIGINCPKKVVSWLISGSLCAVGTGLSTQAWDGLCGGSGPAWMKA